MKKKFSQKTFKFFTSATCNFVPTSTGIDLYNMHCREQLLFPTLFFMDKALLRQMSSNLIIIPLNLQISLLVS